MVAGICLFGTEGDLLWALAIDAHSTQQYFYEWIKY